MRLEQEYLGPEIQDVIKAIDLLSEPILHRLESKETWQESHLNDLSQIYQAMHCLKAKLLVLKSSTY